MALLVERVDYWGRAQFQGLGGKVRGDALHIPRPDEIEEEKEAKKIVTDPGQIARFFGAHLAASDGT